jgi:hypothetical protein
MSKFPILASISTNDLENRQNVKAKVCVLADGHCSWEVQLNVCEADRCVPVHPIL